MRSILFRILSPAVLAATAMTASSAMADTTLQVPFNFKVAGKTLPAGEYMVRHDSTGNFVTLASRGHHPWSYTWVVGPGIPSENSRRIVLKFDGSGDSRALRTVQYGSQITQRLDRKSAEAERESAEVTGGN
jgi:hypothetical protein